MLFALTTDSKEYEKGYYCPNGRNSKYLIGVQIVSEKERQYSNLMQTLTTVSTSTLIRTSFSYKFEVKKEVYYRGDWWIITNIGEDSRVKSPHTMRLLNTAYGKQWIVELVKVTSPQAITLSYNGNGNTDGTVPVDEISGIGVNITLSDGTGLKKSAVAITSWNSKIGGDGVSYTLGGTFVMPDRETILYAIY